MRIPSLVGLLLCTSCGALSVPSPSPNGATARIARQPHRAAPTALTAASGPALAPPGGRVGYGKRRVDHAPPPERLTAFYRD